MRYEYIEPFMDSTIKVLDSVLQSDIAKGDISLVRGERINGDIAVVINLEGYSEGNIILNMDFDTAVRIFNIMNSADFETLTPLGMDTIAELANMIAGNAASTLNDMGFDFVLQPPMVIVKDDLKSQTQDAEIFQVPLFTECGEITMNVALRTS